VEYGANAACIDAQGNIFIAGNFDDDGLRSLRVAKWIGNQWQILGDRFPGGRANALAVDNSGNVYVGGNLTRGFNPDGADVSISRRQVEQPAIGVGAAWRGRGRQRTQSGDESGR
jgi:hypothetical protein